MITPTEANIPDCDSGGPIDDDLQCELSKLGLGNKDRTALCLSGGGIRSATFSLGVIQALAKAGLLEQFDYLSTVSGGGYTGAWLSAWIARAGSVSAVSEQLRDPYAGPLRYLRFNSQYLRTGPSAAAPSVSSLAGMYGQRILLALIVLFPILAGLVFLAWFGSELIVDPAYGREHALIISLVALLLAAIAQGFLCGRSLAAPESWVRSYRALLIMHVYPIGLAAILICAKMPSADLQPAQVWLLFIGIQSAAAFVLGLVMVQS